MKSVCFITLICNCVNYEACQISNDKLIIFAFKGWALKPNVN